MSNTASSGLGFFGAWQVAYLVLYWGIDAPWNKVQHWPFWAWFTVESVAFPTVMSLAILLVVLPIWIWILVVSD